MQERGSKSVPTNTIRPVLSGNECCAGVPYELNLYASEAALEAGYQNSRLAPKVAA